MQTMKNPYVTKAISPDLSTQIDEMMEKIKEAFGIDIGKIQASKIVAWKSKNYHAELTKNRLIDILGSRA